MWSSRLIMMRVRRQNLYTYQVKRRGGHPAVREATVRGVDDDSTGNGWWLSSC